MRQKAGTLLTVISVVLALAGAVLLFQKIQGYLEADKIYDKVREDATSEDGNLDDPDVRLETFIVDWEKFKDTDVVAWIRMGEKISYPVMQGKNNSYYLHHLYNGNYNYAGSIFLNFMNERDFTGRNSIIYGHNMRNGAMFGTLKKYLKKPEDRYFYLFLPDGTRHEYEITSVANVKEGTRAYTYKFADMDSFVDYQKYMIGKSNWDTGAEPEYEEDTKLVSLSTCASIGSKKGHRVMVQGIERSVYQVQEAASWYVPVDRESSESMEASVN